jgi:predicted  nucleic acid-binding Zn-ribbon protein
MSSNRTCNKCGKIFSVSSHKIRAYTCQDCGGVRLAQKSNVYLSPKKEKKTKEQTEIAFLREEIETLKLVIDSITEEPEKRFSDGFSQLLQYASDNMTKDTEEKVEEMAKYIATQSKENRQYTNDKLDEKFSEAYEKFSRNIFTINNRMLEMEKRMDDFIDIFVDAGILTKKELKEHSRRGKGKKPRDDFIVLISHRMKEVLR